MAKSLQPTASPVPEMIRVPIVHGSDATPTVIGTVELRRDQLPSGMAWHLECRPTFTLNLGAGTYETQVFSLVVRAVKPTSDYSQPSRPAPTMPKSLGPDLFGVRCGTCGLGIAACQGHEGDA